MKHLIVILFLLFSVCAIAQTSVPTYELVTVSGTDNYTATVSPAPALPYVNGYKKVFKFTNANTGAATFTLNGGATTTLRKSDGTALSAGDIPPGSVWWVVYDGTASQWRLSGGSGALADGSGTTANGTAVDLGGTLNQPTIIDGDGNDFTIKTDGGITIGDNSSSTALAVDPGAIGLSTAGGLSFNLIDGTGVRSSTIRYNNPYSFSHAQDLPDVGFVNAKVSNTITNGETTIAPAQDAVFDALAGKQSTITFGTGVQSALGNNIGSAGAPVLYNGALGTPSSGNASNMTTTTLSALDGSTNISTTLYADNTKLVLANTQTGDYTLALSDRNKIVEANKATAISFTVPANGTIAFPIGTIIWLRRVGIGVLTIVQDSGVTVTGSSGALTDPGLNVTMVIRKTGTDTWDLQNGTPGTYTSYVPTFTGFSSDPTSIVARYNLIGKMCHVILSMGSDGTSNATTFTVTLPFAASSSVVQVFTNVIVINNGATLTTPGRLDTRLNSNIADLYINSAAGAWSSSNGKRARIIITYEIN